MQTLFAPEPTLAVRVFVGMGSNVGDRFAHLQRAVDLLAETAGLRVDAVSPVYESEAHVLRLGEKQQDYYNAVLECRTTIPARRLLRLMLDVERRSGRVRERGTRWAPRTLDLDILLYGQRTIDSPGLKIPHPRLSERRFVLQPLVDLDPDLFIPNPFAAPARSLLAVCSDVTTLRRLTFRLDVPTTLSAS
jgi:2-amino-4-hydroxy-6-hydroxymethyldihydropteridine diphosphokinase